jgi:pyruvate kinase
VDYVAQSFVRNREDILALKERLRGLKSPPKIIAKIENCEGIMNLDEIMKEVDGVMVARGDMGVSVPIYQIPIIQKVIIQKCGFAGKFSITATQMLDSMTENPRPTRAEVTDVANAILDGSDYVMLSGETAAGIYPIESVQMMSQIIEFTEKSIRKGRVHFDHTSCDIPGLH